MLIMSHSRWGKVPVSPAYTVFNLNETNTAMENEETIVTPEESPVSEIKNRLEAARAFAEEKYQQVRGAAEEKYHQVREVADPYVDKVRGYAHDARQKVGADWDDTCARAKELHKAGEDYVRANPTGSVLGALGIGLVLGLLLGSSRN